MHCNCELVLFSQQEGLALKMHGVSDLVPLHIGPSGAVRIPLSRFSDEINEVDETKEAGLLLEWEGGEPCKAKARHVMKGFSEAGSENIETATPQVTREGALLVTQLIASHLWKIGFMDFAQAIISGDNIDQVLYTSQPGEGVPGMQPGQLLKLEKVCYGLVDRPFCWLQHLQKLLVEKLGYSQSLADLCIYHKAQGDRTRTSSFWRNCRCDG